MKKSLLFLIIAFVTVATLKAQTTGTLTFSVSPTSHNASYGYDHYVAIWIENNSGTFVKTKLKRADSHGTSQHLPVWKASSGSNVVDAVTGASYTNYNTPCSITWNATDVNGNVVADGTYKIRVEFTWAHSSSTASTTYTFSKTSAPDVQSPANQTEFQNVSIDWQPTSTGVSEVENSNGYIVFPNPITDHISVQGNMITSIEVRNANGELISEGNLKHIDMNGQAAGMYFVTITNDKGTFTEKVLKQ